MDIQESRESNTDWRNVKISREDVDFTMKTIKAKGDSVCSACKIGKIKPVLSRYFLKCDCCGFNIHICPPAIEDINL